MRDMPRPRKPYTHREVTRHGATVWYFRKGKGPRTRLNGEYESPEWLADYAAALTASIPAKPKAGPPHGTLGWLVAKYYQSAVWTNLADATKRQRKSVFTRVLAENVALPLKDVTKQAIADGRDARSATPAAAVDFVKAMRSLFRWALEGNYVADDPTVGITASEPKTDGHHTWTVDEVRQFQKVYPLGTKPRLAMDVLLYTGMRASDAVLFGRQHISGGLVEYRSVKTKVDVIIPLLDPLRISIEAGADKAQMAIITTELGGPFSSVNSFGNWFRKHCKKAGVPGRAHGLRKAGATIAAENGASDRQLMAMFGWTTERQAGVYTRKANAKRLAHEAAARVRIE